MVLPNWLFFCCLEYRTLDLMPPHWWACLCVSTCAPSPRQLSTVPFIPVSLCLGVHACLRRTIALSWRASEAQATSNSEVSGALKMKIPKVVYNEFSMFTLSKLTLLIPTPKSNVCPDVFGDSISRYIKVRSKLIPQPP